MTLRSILLAAVAGAALTAPLPAGATDLFIGFGFGHGYGHHHPFYRHHYYGFPYRHGYGFYRPFRPGYWPWYGYRRSYYAAPYPLYSYRAYPAPDPAYAYRGSPPASAPAAECREYTSTVMIGGEEQTAHGTVCPQPDGSWRIAN